MMKKIKNEDLNRLSIKEYKNSKKIPVCIILDNVRSLNNIGSCFRTVDAFLIKIALSKSKLLRNRQSGIKSINANK